MSQFVGIVIASIITVGQSSAHAATAVPAGYRQVAAEYEIPEQLFYAVALTESGRQVPGSKGAHPWPWTLNIRGEAHFFNGRRAAETALQRALVEGIESIDVGLMQVNWRYHQVRLGSAQGALDPYRNLRVGARILSECHRDRADWWAAVGCYHAPANPDRAARYQARVREHWRRLRRAG